MNVLRPVMFTFVLAFAFSIFFSSAEAADKKMYPFGIRISTTMDRDDIYFEQYEVFTSFELPWTSKFPNDWHFESMLDFGVAIIDGQGETGGKGAAVIDFFIYSPNRIVSLKTGIGAGVMSDDELGDADFGGPIFFRFNVGVNYWPTSNFSIGYGLYHESNGSIYTKNPSLNMHQLELRMHF